MVPLPFPKSLFVRLALGLVLIELLLAVLLGSALITRFERGHEQRVVQELAWRIERSGFEIAPLLERGADRAAISIALEALHAHMNRRGEFVIVMRDSDGAIIAEAGRMPPLGVSVERYAQAVQAALGNSEPQLIERDDRLRLIVLARPFSVEGRSPFTLQASASAGSLQPELEQMAMATVFATAALIALTLLTVWLATKRLRAEVRSAAETVDRYSAGELQVRFRPSRFPDFIRLASSLNEMARQVNRRLEALRDQQRQEREILQSMSNGVIALDLEQRVITINRAAERMLRISRMEAPGRLVHELVRQPELHDLIEWVTSSDFDDSDDDSRRIEFELQSRPGMIIQSSIEPLTHIDGAPAGLLLVFNDVTQLRRLENLRSDFAANVSHELRTPITNLKGYVETLIEVGVDDREQTSRFLNIIKQNVDRLQAIVEDVLALARLESVEEAEDSSRALTSVRRLVEEAIRQYMPKAKAKSIKLTSAIPAGMEVEVQPGLIVQALGNLLSNAINYSPPDTTTRIAAERCENGEVAIEVIDQGPGVPPENLPRLFERFYRVDKARSRDVGGTGLGLAIVKHIALAHGGRAEVDSEVGKGSTFRIVLPREAVVTRG